MSESEKKPAEGSPDLPFDMPSYGPSHEVLTRQELEGKLRNAPLGLCNPCCGERKSQEMDNYATGEPVEVNVAITQVTQLVTMPVPGGAPGQMLAQVVTVGVCWKHMGTQKQKPLTSRNGLALPQ